MIIEIKIPSPGESVSEVEIARWLVNEGDLVTKNQELAEIESEKATLNIIAETDGKIKILLPEGTPVKVGEIACTIDTNSIQAIEKTSSEKHEKEIDVSEKLLKTLKAEEKNDQVKITPLAKKHLELNNLTIDDFIKGLRKITKDDVEYVLSNQNIENKELQTIEAEANEREVRTEKMSSLRRKLSERLVAVKNETAMLTTFNEVDMSNVLKIRKERMEQFTKKYGIKLGFLSFFLQASSIALLQFPEINARIDKESIHYHNYCDIGIAVQSAKGLLVPVLRNVEKLSIADIEIKIREFAEKGKNNKISIDELSGGTFTITNGGAFGSLFSTPIINPPQSAILGMHNIVERPVAILGKVEIRPMMYVALSYDHRIIDGKSAVSFLVKIKEFIENPLQLLTNGENPELKLLGL